MPMNAADGADDDDNDVDDDDGDDMFMCRLEVRAGRQLVALMQRRRRQQMSNIRVPSNCTTTCVSAACHKRRRCRPSTDHQSSISR